MRTPQEIFDEIQIVKKSQKEINREYKDALANANEYEETAAKLKEFREKKKQIENVTKQRLGARWDAFEKNKARLAELQETITDVAMSTLMEGKSVEIKDEFQNAYEPVYKITFRKIG